MKLLKVDTLAQARERLLEAAKECLPETEQIALADASDRILAEDIVSGEMIPAFRRSSVDGYAVCSKDTAGATESIPVFLKVLEEVEIGHPAVSKIEPGTCAYVPTGGMVPEGADAMVMVEYSERFGTDEVALYENVPYGKCIVLPGEDVKTGDIVLKAGTRIGPAQAGTLAALGVVQVPVFRPVPAPPSATVVSAGSHAPRFHRLVERLLKRFNTGSNGLFDGTVGRRHHGRVRAWSHVVTYKHAARFQFAHHRDFHGERG